MDNNAQQILEMEVIVEHIFNFLSLEDLKRARLVCRLWNFEGAKKILPSCYFRVPSRFHKQSQKRKDEEEKLIFNFLRPQLNQSQGEPGPGQSKNYQSLKLKPLPNVWISTVKDIKILYRLGVLSGNVKTLRFPYFCEWRTDEENKELPKSFKNLLQMDLTSLSAFYFHESNPTLIDCMGPWGIQQLLEVGKGHLIKSVDFSVVQSFSAQQIEIFGFDWFFFDEHLEIFETWIEMTSGLCLESIIIGNGIKKLRQQQQQQEKFHRVINVLNKMLAISATSLREVKVMDTLGDVIELQIPTLPKLKSLTVLLTSRNGIRIEENSNSRVFPNVAEAFSFPNLSNITIGILANDRIGRRIFDRISLTDIEKLLPGLNPHLKSEFSVYKYKGTDGGKNHLLICPQNSPPAEHSAKAISKQIYIPDLDEEQDRIRRKNRSYIRRGLFFLAFLIGALALTKRLLVQNPPYLRITYKEVLKNHRQIWDIHHIVHGLIPNSVCIGRNYTWKIPPIFACPIHAQISRDIANSSILALNLRHFTCDEITNYSTSNMILEFDQGNNQSMLLDLGLQYHIFLPHEIIPGGFRIFSRHNKVHYTYVDKDEVIIYF